MPLETTTALEFAALYERYNEASQNLFDTFGSVFPEIAVVQGEMDDAVTAMRAFVESLGVFA